MAGGVAVGAGTRAYREGARPGGSVAVGTGTRAYREGAGGVAVGTGTRAYQEGIRSRATPWSPPPIPAGFYNPIRDIEAAEGKKGTEQTLSGGERQRTDAENTYGTNLSVLGEREANERRAQQETLANLARSYQRLGVQQGDQANAAGTLYGGALISAAQKRTANEGREKSADEARFGEQRQADENERGRLSTGLQQLIGPGGSLTESMQNARANENTFEQGINTLKGSEASGAGYVPPTGSGWKTNPLNGQAYREVRQGGKTVHVYANGRRVVL